MRLIISSLMALAPWLLAHVVIKPDRQDYKYRLTDMIFMHHCMMKGFLSFLLLWMISKKEMTGAEIAEELRIRKGHKPSPGTIYPALKDLKNKGLIQSDDQKRYSLTETGQEELQSSIQSFFDTFWDIDEMRECCCRNGHHVHGPHHHRFHGHGNNCREDN